MPARRSEPDQALLSAWRAGDREAGARLTERHFSTVYRFFASKAEQAAEDLAQQTFLACLTHVERYDPERGSFRGFLFGIARNQLLRHFRAERYRGKRRLDEYPSIAVMTGSPTQALARRRDARLVLAALREIPFDLQLTLELYYWAGLSFDEIGDVLGVPPNTVKSRLARARADLRKRLARIRKQRLEVSSSDSFGRWSSALRNFLRNEDTSEA